VISYPNSGQAGFATPAATVLSLAIAMLASAVMALSVASLRYERTEFARLRAETALEGAQIQAAAFLSGHRANGPVRWQTNIGRERAEVIAEPETRKLGPSASPDLIGSVARALGSSDPDRIAAVLSALQTSRSTVAPGSIDDLGGSMLWRRCARSIMSIYGTATDLPNLAFDEPGAASAAGHTAELWRIRITSETGWVDDRVVRFTGSAEAPLSVAAWSFGRGSPLGLTCQAALARAGAQ